MARMATRQRPDGKVKVIRVLRISQMMERQFGDQAFHSPDLQINGIDGKFDQDFGRDNWELADVQGNYGQATWADWDVTGGTMDRDGLNAAIDAVIPSGAHAIGFYNLSRWGRVVGDALERMDEVLNMGAMLRSAQEPVELDDPTGRLIVTQLLSFGDYQRRMAGAVWSDVIDRRAVEQGRHHGVPPLGMYRPVSEATGKPKGDIEPHPETGPVVVDAFEQIGNHSKSRWTVGHQLAKAGHIARWEYIPGLLTNRTYLRLHDPKCVGTNCARLDPHGSCGEVRSFLYKIVKGRKVRAEEVWSPGCHEGLIDVELWDKVQARLKEMQAKRGATRLPAPGSVAHELSGACRCYSCGKALWLGRVRKTLVLKDPSMHRTGCRGIGVPSADGVLAVVINDLRELVESRSIDRRGATGRAKKTQSRKPDLATLRRQRKGIEQRVVEIEVDLAGGTQRGTAEVARATLEGLTTRLTEITAKEAELLTPVERPPVVIPTSAVEFVRDYDKMSIERRNDWFRQHCTVIVGHRPEGAPWRMPYAERVDVLWSWDPS